MNRFQLSLLASLGLANALPAQTARDFLDEAKALLVDREPALARDALSRALEADPSLAEAHLYFGLVDMLLFLESPQSETMLSELGGLLEVDWKRGRLGFEWFAERDAAASIPAEARWQYASDATAEGGDALRVEIGGATFATHSTFVEGQLIAGPVRGPGTIFYRARLENPTNSASPLYIQAQKTFEGAFDPVFFPQLGSEWTEFSVPLQRGEWNVSWNYFIDASGEASAPVLWLDAVRFVPDDGVPSPLDDGSSEGPTLANGIDNATWTVSAEIASYSMDEEVDWLAPAANTAGPLQYLSNDLGARIDTTLGHLAQVPTSGFSSLLEYDPGQARTLTIDSGDVSMIKALLEGLQSLVKLVTSAEGALDLNQVDELEQLDAIGSLQSYLTVFPHLLQTAEPANRTAAEAALRRAYTHYLDASSFIRERAPGEAGFFNLDPLDLPAEAQLRADLTLIIDSLDAPQNLLGDDAGEGGVEVFLGALFDPSADWSGFLPQFSENRPIAGTFPDVTFGGLLPEMGAADWAALWSGNDAFAWNPSMIVSTAPPAPGRASSSLRTTTRALTMATDESANQLILYTQERVSDAPRFQLWDRSAGTLKPVDVDTDGRRIEQVQNMVLSGDGRTLFMVAGDSVLAGQNPPLVLPVTFEEPVMRAPAPSPDQPVDERMIAVDFLSQPNGGRGPASFDLTLSLPLEGFQPLSEVFFGRLELERPDGAKFTANFSNILSEAEAEFPVSFALPAASDSANRGEWTLRLTASQTEAMSPSLVIEEAAFRFDQTRSQIYRRPTTGGPWTLVSTSTTGGPSNGAFFGWLVSNRTGDRIAFVSDASDLEAEGADRPYGNHAFLYDLASDQFKCLSAPSAPGIPHTVGETAISADGDRVVFFTSAGLVAADTNGLRDVYLYEVSTETTRLMSTDAAGTLMTAGSRARAADCHISADGRFVTFASDSVALLTGTESLARVPYTLFRKDIASGGLESFPEAGAEFIFEPTLSPDGHYAYYYVFDDSFEETFLRLIDLSTRTVTPLEKGPNGFGPLIASAAGLTAFSDNRGTLFLHDPQSGRLNPYRFEEIRSAYVAMGQAGLVLSGTSAAISVPVTLSPGSDPLDTPVTATVTTRGGSALPFWNYRDDALAPVSLTPAAPSRSIDIPLHSTAFRAEPGVFEVRLESVTGRARKGFPDRTTVVLEDFADPERYAAWLERVFTDPSDRANLQVSGARADPDLDGRMNLIEFALGSDPLIKDLQPPLLYSPTPWEDTFTLGINPDAGLRFYIEHSSDLRSWTTRPLETMEGFETRAGDNGRVQVQFNTDTGGELERFYRLRIETDD